MTLAGGARLRELQQRCNEIRARAKKATKGPWLTDIEMDGVFARRMTVVRAGAKRVVSVGQTRPHHSVDAEANADFIAHAREDVEWLLSQLEDAAALLVPPETRRPFVEGSETPQNAYDRLAAKYERIDGVKGCICAPGELAVSGGKPDPFCKASTHRGESLVPSSSPELSRFVALVARLTKDGEITPDHPEGFDMPSDDAVETLGDLIDQARQLIQQPSSSSPAPPEQQFAMHNYPIGNGGCGETQPYGKPFICTREPGHSGLHAAHDNRGVQVATWTEEASSPAPQEREQ